MGAALQTFLEYIQDWFASYDDVHGIFTPFIELVESLIGTLGEWFGQQ
jgi:hypothetical protein